eukprot:m.97560 g.97560  ORF g.97560 m.97560 type:complete len:91 (+) comp8670_c0_seq1:339-611(+)
MRSCVLSLMLAAQLVSASLHLLSYGMLPAHHRPLLVLWLILGAGVRDANGEWSLSKEIYNNAPQVRAAFNCYQERFFNDAERMAASCICS